MVSKQKLTVWAVIMLILFIVSVVAFAESTTVSPSASPVPDPTTVIASPVPTKTTTAAPTPVHDESVTGANCGHHSNKPGFQTVGYQS